MSRPAALPIEKWKMQTVSGDETARYSQSGRARCATRGCTQLGEDVGLVAGRAQLPLDRERLVADRVAVGERGEQLVDPHVPAHASRRPPARPSCGLALRQHVLERLVPARQRLDAARELQVAVAELAELEVEPGQLEHQVVEQVRGEAVEVGLARERRDHRRRVPEQLLHGPQQPARRSSRKPPRLER